MWPIWITLAAALGILALLLRDRDASVAAFVITSGLIAMRPVVLFFDPPALWLASAGVWVLAAMVILQNTRLAVIPLLLVGSALCYTIGRGVGDAYGMGNTAMLVADLFGLAALGYLGGRIIVALVHRMASLGGGHRRRAHRRSLGLSAYQAEK